ncbi:MAG: hypothetical protein ACLSAP_01135 [Oscillospiraceae bacterium]
MTEFVVGHYGGFDYLAAKAVIAAKQLHLEITLSLLIPTTLPKDRSKHQKAMTIPSILPVWKSAA